MKYDTLNRVTAEFFLLNYQPQTSIECKIENREPYVPSENVSLIFTDQRLTAILLTDIMAFNGAYFSRLLLTVVCLVKNIASQTSTHVLRG